MARIDAAEGRSGGHSPSERSGVLERQSASVGKAIRGTGGGGGAQSGMGVANAMAMLLRRMRFGGV